MNVQHVKSSVGNFRHITSNQAKGAARAVGTFIGTPNRGNVAADSLLLGMYALYLHAFVIVTIAAAITLDQIHDHHLANWVKTARTITQRRNRNKKAGKKLPLLRALKDQTGLTTKGRREKWCRTTSERLGINPPFRYVSMRLDDADNELWDVRVPITPHMNPSLFARPNYAAGIKGCVKGKCYGVDINASIDRAGIAHILITRTDIRSIVAGPAPILTTYPTSIADPVQIGINAVRKPRTLNLIDRNGIGIFGMPGSGKSTLLHTIIAHAVAAPDATVYLADLKDGIDGEAWEHSTIYTESVLEVRQWIARYCRPNGSTFTYADHATARARQLKQLGIRKWEPGCGMNAEIIIIDEIDNLTATDQAALAWMTTKLRAIGVRPIIATQLPQAKTLDTRLSNALNVRIAFVVDNVTAAGIALGLGAVGRGYDASLLPSPGYCLVKDATEQDASMVRTHMLEPDDVDQIARRFPLVLADESGSASESDANRTLQGGPMEEGLAEPDRPVSDPTPFTPSDPVDPPADAVADPKKRALWDAMPGTRKKLCDASGYSPSQASAILAAWSADGKCWTIGKVWHHRGATTQLRIVR